MKPKRKIISFVYIWYDKNKKMYYLGSHTGYIGDGYICSSTWMKAAYKKRPSDFKRRIISYCTKDTLINEEQRYLNMIKPDEFGTKYYNLVKLAGGRGNAGANKGKHWSLTEETKAKMKKPKTKDHAKSISMATKGKSKPKHIVEKTRRTCYWKIQDSNGNETIISNLKKFKIEHKLLNLGSNRKCKGYTAINLGKNYVCT